MQKTAVSGVGSSENAGGKTTKAVASTGDNAPPGKTPQANMPAKSGGKSAERKTGENITTAG